jgi:hypothetical protein
VRATVLRYVLAGAGDRGGLWWLEPMMEAACMYL